MASEQDTGQQQQTIAAFIAARPGLFIEQKRITLEAFALMVPPEKGEKEQRDRTYWTLTVRNPGAGAGMTVPYSEGSQAWWKVPGSAVGGHRRDGEGFGARCSKCWTAWPCDDAIRNELEPDRDALPPDTAEPRGLPRLPGDGREQLRRRARLLRLVQRVRIRRRQPHRRTHLQHDRGAVEAATPPPGRCRLPRAHREHGTPVMAFTLIIATDNAAFGEAGSGENVEEIARILGVVAEQITNESATERGVFDVNGNRVGSWRLE